MFFLKKAKILIYLGAALLRYCETVGGKWGTPRESTPQRKGGNFKCDIYICKEWKESKKLKKYKLKFRK